MTPSRGVPERLNKHCLEHRQPNIFAPYTIGRAHLSRITVHTKKWCWYVLAKGRIECLTTCYNFKGSRWAIDPM